MFGRFRDIRGFLVSNLILLRSENLLCMILVTLCWDLSVFWREFHIPLKRTLSCCCWRESSIKCQLGQVGWQCCLRGLPWWLGWQCRRPGFDPWVGKIPWRRTWQPTPVFLPGELFKGFCILPDLGWLSVLAYWFHRLLSDSEEDWGPWL